MQSPKVLYAVNEWSLPPRRGVLEEIELIAASGAGGIGLFEGKFGETRVAEIKEKTVVMDMNHPMAGKTLIFDVKVVDIQPAPPPPSAGPSSQSAPPSKSTNPAAPGKPSAPAQPAKPAEPAKK